MDILEDWKREIEVKTTGMLALKRDINHLIRSYVTLGGLRTIYNNIENGGWEIKSHYFDEDDSKYAIFIELADDANVVEEKRRIVERAFRSIDDEFVIKHIKISTAKRMKRYAND